MILTPPDRISDYVARGFWGTTTIDLLYDLVANNKKPEEAFVKGQLIPVTKDNVDEFAKNWEKWLKK